MGTGSDPEIDQKRARLAETSLRLLLADRRRVVVAGASGWIGRTTLALLHRALGPELFARRIACFGSREALLQIKGELAVRQLPLSHLRELDRRPTLLFHLAFLTKDRVSGMDEEDYAAANRQLSRSVLDALDGIGVDRLFLASSGAAAFADDPSAAADLRLYGGLKREDEERFAAWAQAKPDERRAVVGRIYSLSGPHINKHETYALASFILDALAGRPIEVRAAMPVVRSYVAVRELVSLVIAALLAEQGPPVLRFDTGGKALELAEVAACVAETLGGRVLPRPVHVGQENRYVGDEAAWNGLLHAYGIEPLPLADQIAETAAFLAPLQQPCREAGLVKDQAK